MKVIVAPFHPVKLTSFAKMPRNCYIKAGSPDLPFPACDYQSTSSSRIIFEPQIFSVSSATYPEFCPIIVREPYNVRLLHRLDDC
jgi:hypothetical protein